MELPHELLLTVFSHLDEPSLTVLAITSRDIAASVDEQWRTQVLQR